jgi:dsRNA-specific ribonuclease
MTAKGTIAVPDNLLKVFEKLEAARKMQDGWMDRGLDFVDLYVEDAGGDWLEKWGKSEKFEFDTIRGVDVEAVKAALDFPDFQNTTLLEIALTRPFSIDDCRDRSSEFPTWQDVNYQRLTLLGSAILGAVVTDYLYREYPNLNREALSELKASLVNKKKLSEFAVCLNLNELSWRGYSQKKLDKSERNKFLSKTFEAVFGAIYLECDRDFFRAGEWLIQHLIKTTVDRNINLIKQSQTPPKNEEKRLAILGADILEAIAIDYLYNRFPESNASELTHWKNILMAKDIFPKNFQAKLGSQYLELESNFSRTRNWLVDNFIKTTVEELVEATENN